MNIVQKAKMYALHQHGNQHRPNATKEPIAVHLSEVASYVSDEALGDVYVAAAWLHDVVEDTAVTVTDIEAEFGLEVAGMVSALTDPPDWAQKPLAARKLLQADRIALQNNSVRLIKLADQISNIRSVLLDPPSDWNENKSAAYIEGAYEVGRACGGVSAHLDALLRKYAGA